ncbi:hypothetical protein [Parasitella parasitica]|uniref:Apoptogenic protein 1, mitochondrial n=1 Tax=Parasitella parasitica TaxID=35722 RepID=A0A0B7NMA9_9FUNG|nr:hypothetical protein [Parasitella parasitica]
MALFLRNAIKSTWIHGYKRAMATTCVANKSAKQQDWSENLETPVAADMIGTPDPISNLRPVKYYISPHETAEEREWRESCQRVDAFNQSFWQNNNMLFMKAKAEFEDQYFLNKAYDRQMEYNRAWWKMNVAQLYPGFKAAIRSLFKPKNEPGHATQFSKGNGFWEKSFES